MTYLDAYILSVKTDQKEVFAQHAQKMDSLFLEYGALRVVEAWGDDIPDGKLTSYTMAVKAEPGETVVTGLVFWPDKATRDAGMDKAMQDPRFTAEGGNMPFDGKRMIFGGFDIIFDMSKDQPG